MSDTDTKTGGRERRTTTIGGRDVDLVLCDSCEVWMPVDDWDEHDDSDRCTQLSETKHVRKSAEQRVVGP